MRRAGYTIFICFLISTFMSQLWSNAQESDDWIKGVAALQRKDFREATDLLTKKDIASEQNVEILMYRGQSLLLTGDYEGALQAFYLADQKKPGSSSFWISKTYVLLGDYGKAAVWLESHLSSPYRRAQKQIVMDTILSRMENTPGWRTLWQKKEWYSLKDKGIAEAEFMAEQEDYQGAVARTEKLMNRYGEDPQLYDLHAMINMDIGAFAIASVDYQHALQMQPDDTAALAGLARVEEASGHPDQAIDAWTRLLKVDPVRFDALINRADVYAAKGVYDQAINDLQTYLTYFPDQPEIIFQMGNYASADGKYMEAMQYYSKVIDQDPSNPIYFKSRADVYMKTHTYRYAIQDYGMALDLDPSNGELYLRKGEALLKTGKKKDACFSFRQAYHFGQKEAVTYLQQYCDF